MKILIKNVEGLVLPNQSNSTDSGYDVFAVSDPEIIGVECGSDRWQRIDYIRYKTNLFIAPVPDIIISSFTEKNFHVLLHSRSSISKMNLVLANSVGISDRGYRGELEFRFKYIIQPEDLRVYCDRVSVVPNMDKIYKKGDRIGQLLAEEQINIDFELVNELPDSDRGTGGFGSTELKETKL